MTFERQRPSQCPFPAWVARMFAPAGTEECRLSRIDYPTFRFNFRALAAC